jgi:hypothetical protein
VMGFCRHQQMHAGPPGRSYCWVPPPSLARIMSIGPHHAADTFAREAPKRGQWKHVVWQGITAGNWSEFLCLGGYNLGGAPRGMRPPPIPAAGAPPAGPWQEPIWV